eukprot:gene16780-19935_t
MGCQSSKQGSVSSAENHTKVEAFAATEQGGTSVVPEVQEDIVNSVLADTAWGDTSADGTTWTLRCREPSVKTPKKGLVKYMKFLDTRLPGPENKKERDRLATSFTDNGQPGELLAKHFQLLRSTLLLPEEIKGTAAAKECGLHGDSAFIIPAFFKLLLQLKKDRRSFSLVFRSFGKELEEVAHELNMFCEGRHPAYPEACFDGTDGQPDMRLSFLAPENFGAYYRVDEGTALVLGTLEPPAALQNWDGVQPVEELLAPEESFGELSAVQDTMPRFDNLKSFLQQ